MLEDRFFICPQCRCALTALFLTTTSPRLCWMSWAAQGSLWLHMSREKPPMGCFIHRAKLPGMTECSRCCFYMFFICCYLILWFQVRVADGTGERHDLFALSTDPNLYTKPHTAFWAVPVCWSITTLIVMIVCSTWSMEIVGTRREPIHFGAW